MQPHFSCYFGGPWPDMVLMGTNSQVCVCVANSRLVWRGRGFSLLPYACFFLPQMARGALLGGVDILMSPKHFGNNFPAVLYD